MPKVKESKFNTASLKEAALAYAELGWPTLPLKKETKIPAGWEWHGKEAKKLSKEEIEKRWANTPYAKRYGASLENNIGIIGGVEGSNLIFLDIDHQRILDDIAGGILVVDDTISSKTSGIKKHLIFTTDKEYPSIDIEDKARNEYASLRSKGKYIAVPPSVHPTTNEPYQYASGEAPDQIKPAQFTDHIYQYLIALKAELNMEGWEPVYEKKYQTDDRLREFIQKELKPKVDIRLVMQNIGGDKLEQLPGSETGSYVHYAVKDSKGGRSIVWDKNKNYIYDNHAGRGFDSIEFVRHWRGWDFKDALNWLCDLFNVERFEFGGKQEASKDDIQKAKKILIEILKQAKTDKTAIFAKKAIEAATLLYAHELQLYHKYIDALKELKTVNWKDLERAVKAKQKETDRKKSKAVLHDLLLPPVPGRC